jgi:hypothetical protein
MPRTFSQDCHHANERKNPTKQAKQKEERKQKPKATKTVTKTPHKKLAQ